MGLIDLTGLNPEQVRGATHLDGPLLILAGAGSGKTRVITTRIAWLISKQRIKPSQILALTFTNKAAREMKERVAGLLSQQATKGLSISTFHAFCVRLLRAKINLLGYREKFSIFDTTDRLQLITDIMKDLKLDLTILPPEKVAWKISDAKNALVHPGSEAQEFFQDELLSRIYRQYQTTLKGFNILDFDDLLMLAVDLFAKAPEELERYVGRWSYLMVDEYQDTNLAQYRLLRCLTRGHSNLCVVGDDDQSIYAWRGADINNILNFEKDFPGTLVIRLEQNYRSNEKILLASNALIANNTSRKGKKLWTEKLGGEFVRVIGADDEAHEADLVLNEILSLRNTHGVAFSEIAIVFRTNFQTKPFEDCFLNQGIPFEVIGGTKTFDRREVKDVLAYLRLVANRNDEVALLRIINRPKRGIGALTIEKIVKWAEAHSLSLYQVILEIESVTSLDENARYRVGLFSELIEEYRKKLLGAKSFVPVLKDLVRDSGYLEGLLKDAGNDLEKYQRSLRWLQELYNDLELYEKSEEGKISLYAYLERVSLLLDDRNNESEFVRDALTLMTMHASKGLEFPYVFVVGVEEGNIPHAHSVEAGTVEEERRLFYVAMTRAMKRLYLSFAGERRRYGEAKAVLPSRFLDEIDPSVIEWLDPSQIATEDDLVAAFEKVLARNQEITNKSS